jgi:hypothetical protein
MSWLLHDKFYQAAVCWFEERTKEVAKSWVEEMSCPAWQDVGSR